MICQEDTHEILIMSSTIMKETLWNLGDVSSVVGPSLAMRSTASHVSKRKEDRMHRCHKCGHILELVDGLCVNCRRERRGIPGWILIALALWVAILLLFLEPIKRIF